MITESLLQSAQDLERRVREKIRTKQAGVPTSFDNVVLAGVQRLREASAVTALPGVEGWRVHELFLQYTACTARPPLISYDERAAETVR